MTGWLDGFQQVVFAQSLGSGHRAPVTRVVWHSTEGWCAEHAFNVYAAAAKGACPNITTEYAGTGGHGTTRTVTQRNFQHVGLDSASYALQRGNPTHVCRVETNGAGVIQIERVGFADDTVTVEELRWLGETVLAPILAACPLIPPSVYKGPRMTEQEWVEWPGGQCGHKDVCCQPDGHTDPGDLDLDVILHYALELNDSLTPKDHTMPDYLLRNGHDHNDPWLAVYSNGALRHIGGTEAGYLTDPTLGLVDKPPLIVDELDTAAYTRARQSAGA